MEHSKKLTIKSYDETVKDYAGKTDDFHQVEEGKKFASLLDGGAIILDLGCGPGRDAKIFADKGFKVIGVDLSKNMIKMAKKRVKNAEFRVMDICRLDFKDNYFDGIWASASFVHIPKGDIAKALKEAHRVLKRNGIFYISVKEGKGECIEPDDRYGGVKKFWSFFSKKKIENLLNRAGFDIIESYIKKNKDNYATHPWIEIFCRKSKRI